MPAQSPYEELAERAAEALPMRTAAFAIGMEDHRRMLRDHAKRLKESHKAMAKAAGMEDVVAESDEDMGDIIVTGDIKIGDNGQGRLPWEKSGQQPTQQPPAPPPAASNSSTPGWLKTAGLLAAGAAVGGGIPASIAAYYALRPTPQQSFDDHVGTLKLLKPDQPSTP